MVSTNDLILTGGLLLGVLYLKKRSDQVSTIAPADYYQQVQEVNIQRLSEFGSRIEQLKDIRSQILGYEKGQAEEQISYLQSQISEAQQAGSAAQRQLVATRGALPITKTIADYLKSVNWDLSQGFNYFLGRGELLKAQAVQTAATQRALTEQIIGTEEFIKLAQEQQADIMAKYSELEQIV